MLYTIGHSNHDIKTFTRLLISHQVDAIADVRSHPFSKRSCQFSWYNLKPELEAVGIAYAFVGRELGARSENPNCYRNGKVQYNLLAEQPEFKVGIDRILNGIANFTVCLMCAERDPIECHRALLVSRHLSQIGVESYHIHPSGQIENHHQLESRILTLCNISTEDLFTERNVLLEEAYSIQSNKVAYQLKPTGLSEGESYP